MDQAQPKSWWGRNWKWFVPVGCLSSLAILVGFVGLIMTFVFNMMKSSNAYKQALSRARSNPAVVNALGSPIRESIFISGSINVNGASGNADLAIPISGSKGKGTIYVEARKAAGEWSFTQLAVKVDRTNERISLLNENK